MNYDDVLEVKKRMEFNKTESEVLVKLVGDAMTKGEKAQQDMARMGRNAGELAHFLEGKQFIHNEKDFAGMKPEHTIAVGIDGSVQLVGGAGGIWYAPVSVARIIFESGFGTQPKVEPFWVEVVEIAEQEDPKPNVVATITMLGFETKAILNWGSQNRESYVMIDGPIVDPPILGFGGVRYVRDRAEAITACLSKSTVIGVVKRSRDKFYRDFLEGEIQEGPLKPKLLDFPSDQYLMAFVFSNYRSKGERGPLYTSWIPISDQNDLFKKYKENGVYLISFFFQKSVMSQVLRIDVPFLDDPLLLSKSRVDALVATLAKTLDLWTYPGQDYPVPIFLAHEKCNIREGCAEVLYDEIMTRGHSIDPGQQMIWSWLR